MAHWLHRLLNPQSIAIVGASERSGSLGAITQRQLLDSGYRGDIFPVNPKYQSLFGQTCYADLESLPGVPDLVVYAISGLALEQSFNQALALQVGGIVIYASNTIENDSEPRLTARLRSRAVAAGIAVCGGNSMGFYNYDASVMVSFDSPPVGRPTGHIALIAHSGSGMTYLANNDARFCFNYVIASAQEINASVGDYMDYLLEQPSTRVIAILLETVRDVPAFVAALQKAQAQSVPVVITSLGRTEKAAQMARSHSGAIVGSHAALVAVCERYNAILCRDVDEMMVTALLFASGCQLSAGALASMLDSGGMREQMVDLAEHYELRFAQISEATKQVLRANLEAGLEAVNPMDGMGALGNHSAHTFLECGKALLDDVDTALLSFEFEFRDDFCHYPELFEVVRQLASYNDKPVVLINSCGFASITRTAAELVVQGVPVINGIDLSMRAIRNLMQYHAQSAVEAAMKIRHMIVEAEGHCDMSQIKNIVVESFDVAIEIIGRDPEKWRPKTRETADHSLPYCVAVALSDGRITPHSFSSKRLNDTALRALVQKVKVVEQPDFTNCYPEAMPNRLRVTTMKGKNYVVQVDHPLGHPKRPMSDSEVEGKFHRFADRRIGAYQANRLIERVWELEKITDVSMLMQMFPMATNMRVA